MFFLQILSFLLKIVEFRFTDRQYFYWSRFIMIEWSKICNREYDLKNWI